jgi:hypothetical protein
VLEDDFQFGEIAAQRDELLLDEHGLAVEQVDVAAGDLAVHQKQHAGFLHGFEGGVGLAQVGHARIAVGGGTGGVELAATTPAALARPISSGGRLSVRYSVISGSKLTPAGTAARMRCL